MKAIILAIGQELTQGEFNETNSQVISEELTNIGIEILRIEIIPDEIDLIINAIEKATNEADIIIATGGLGPTDDDLTRYAFATSLNLPLEINEEELTRIKSLFKQNNIEYSKDNDRQAFFPKSSTIILNRQGTASGFYLEKNHTMVFALPGVPSQCQKLLKKFVINKLKQSNLTSIPGFTAKTQNISEAKLNELFREKVKPKKIKWGTVSKEDGIYLKIKAVGKHAEKSVDKIKQKVQEIFKNKIWGWDEQELPEIIANTLSEKLYTLSTVESCTGGLISKLITDIPGSSKYFEGGAIVYSNKMKTDFLDVKEQTIKQYGAVSKQTVKELAENGRKKFKTDCCISVSGIAGPTGGSDEKPVGTVWIGISTPHATKAYHYVMPGTREQIRQRTAYYALGLLQRILEKQDIEASENNSE